MKVSFTKLKDFVGPLILLAIGVEMLFLSWQKWPDILIDFGRELYVPWQLCQGAVLYKDIIHLYGPFSQYFNSWLFRIFGVNLMTLALFNIGLIIALAYLIYRIFLDFSDRIVAAVTGATFLSIFAFSQYVGIGNYNFVCPYSHEVIHGIFLSFFSLYFFMIYLRRHNLILLGMTGASLGLVFLTKAEIFFALAPALSSGLLFLIVIGKPTFLKIIKTFGVLFLCFLLPILGFVIFFNQHMSLIEAVDRLILQYRVILEGSVPSNIFYKRLSGIDAPLSNLKKMLMITAWYAIALVIISLFAYLITRLTDKSVRRAMVYLIFIIIILKLSFIAKCISLEDMFRPLPLLLSLFGLYLFVTLFRLRRDPQAVNRLLPLYIFTVFAFFLLTKMILNVHIFHYGFALAMPATLLLVMVILYQVPAVLGKLFGATNFVRGLGLVLIGAILFAHIVWAKGIYDLKKYAVGSEGDAIVGWSPEVSNRDICMNFALEKIKEFIKPNENFVVLPEGIMLNYLSRRKNPSLYFEFTPPIVRMFGEERIIKSFSASSPDYIVLTHRDTSEYGFRYFGRDYGEKIFSWIKENYALIVQIGPTPLNDEGFGIIIARRIKKSL